MNITKVYHVEVVKKVSTSFDADNNPVSKVTEGLLKFVGDEEMEQFIGYTEKRGKDGRMVRTPKVEYHKQLGFLTAKCVRVCDKKQKSVGTESKDMERVNLLLNPPKVKSTTENLTERMDRIEAESKKLKAENEALKAGQSINDTPVKGAETAPQKVNSPSKTRGNKS